MDRDVAAMFGGRLRRARFDARLRQSDVCVAAGVSQSMISRMELGDGGSIPLVKWSAIADAVGMELSLDQVTADTPSSIAVRLARRCHRLVVDLALEGGWAAWTDASSNETMLVRVDRREVAIVTVWDVIADVSAAVAALERRLDQERLERGSDWRVGGVAIIPANGDNRRRLTEAAPVAENAFPERGSLWLAALGGGRMPMRSGLIWTDQRFTRLRPMLPYLDRRPRDRNRGRRRGRAR